MLLHALVSRELGEVIEFYADANDAAAALEELLTDEPLWHEELALVAVKLPDATAAALCLRTPAGPVLALTAQLASGTADGGSACGSRRPPDDRRIPQRRGLTTRGVEPESASP